MSSYYKRVTGNLKENLTARVSDINDIQTNIQDSEKEQIKELHGESFIIGEEEDAFKLTATTDYIDQININCDDENKWISFYDRYLRQSLCIEKSSIESIILHMYNDTTITPTIYAEIRNSDFEIVQEANTTLPPTLDEEYTEVTFNFNKYHIPTGVYYFVLRPVDISETDYESQDDALTYNSGIIGVESFRVKYDIDGDYHGNTTDFGDTTDTEIMRGLEASYDGSNYLDAYLLQDQFVTAEDLSSLDTADPNYDLYFTETFSSGNTYLIQKGEAIVSGEKIQPFDTHVKINAASTMGDRTDLVTLRADGTYDVIEGSVYEGDAVYPTDTTGLPIAYITTFKNASKPSVIEQDDEYTSGIRRRSILERMRRVEKKLNYQVANNSPSRIKYNCEVDPVMFNNGLQKPGDTEGSYKLGFDTNDDGDPIVTTSESSSLIWSIVKGNYKYYREEKKKTSAYCQVYNVETSTTKGKPSHSSDGLYVAYISTDKISSNNDSRTLKNPVKGEEIKVTIKDGKTAKHKKVLTTNSNGRATWNLNGLGLKKGKYTVETKVSGNDVIKTKLTVHKGNYKATASHKTVSVTLTEIVTAKVKEKSQLKDAITGDDSVDDDGGKIDVDVKNGVISLATTKNSEGYITNEPLTDHSKPKFSHKRVSYKIYKDPKKVSEFPLLHLKFERDTYIKAIKPYVGAFKNMKSFGVLLFKNDKVDKLRDHKRTIIEKSFRKDPIYTNIFKETHSLEKVKGNKEGEQKLDNFVTFEVNKHLEAGTYSLLVYGEVKKGKDEGIIYLRHYDVHGNLEEYGVASKCTGSSNLSTLTMKSGDTTSDTWNLIIKQKRDVYFNKGVVTSSPKVAEGDIKACKLKAHITTPKGCYVHIEVSNDGGQHWVETENKQKVTFPSANNIFMWRMRFESSNGIYTPTLSYSKKHHYAVKVIMKTESMSVPYEDYGRCYETPLFNANNITRTFVADYNIVNRFSEWEWARIFMLDELEKTHIDICFSYTEDDYLTNVNTLKDHWNRKIFFSQIFADLQLSDFSTESIDYDNYEANVEFDEHNFQFKMDSESIMHNTGGIALAVPLKESTSYHYGNIASGQNEKNISSIFEETFDTNKKYEYIGNYTEPTQHQGAHTTSGSYIGAVYTKTNNNCPNNYNDLTYENAPNISDEIIDKKYEYVMTGVSFENGVEVDENKSELVIQLFPISGIVNQENITRAEENLQAAKDALTNIDETRATLNAELQTKQTNLSTATGDAKIALEKEIADLQAKLANLEKALEDEIEAKEEELKTKQTTYDSVRAGDFAPNSFNINIALTLDGTLSKDVVYDSEGNQVFNYTNGLSVPVTIPLTPNKFTPFAVDISQYLDAFEANGIRSIGITVNPEAQLQRGEGIGIGPITASSYSRRPYVPYMYTGQWERLKWQPLKDDATIQNICYTNEGIFFLYPQQYPLESEETITNPGTGSTATNLLGGLSANTYYRVGTTLNNTGNTAIKSMKREKNKITAIYGEGNNATELTTTNTGNEVIFNFPKDITGDIFRIDVDIPLTIYDLIDIEYYVLHMVNTSADTTTDNLVDESPQYNGYKYDYYGYISKGEINFKFYDTTDIQVDTQPVETFSLPSWGRMQMNAHVMDKGVRAWFKKRSAASQIKTIIVERNNPMGLDTLQNLSLVLCNILLFNADVMPSLGPQMQMRIYPTEDLSEIQIRKVGCVYRI